ncbi:MAG: glycosyltransferase family 9 protein [Phycisphaerales bacterium]|nr:glycosyltransferase family 9 protein [Phycisphaerales bacterium]
MPPPPSRILIIRPSALGDVCRTVPALVSLRATYPHAQIDWLVQDANAEAIRHHPALSNVIEFRRRQLSDGLQRGTTTPFFKFLGLLRRNKYDVVYDLQGLFRSGFMTWATRAPRRVGLKNAREFGWFGLTHKYNAPWTLHAVDRMLEVLKADGVSINIDMRLYASPASRERVASDPQLRAGPFAVVAPTSRWLAKRWPADRFAVVAAELLNRGYAHVVLVGAPGERGQCAALTDLAARDPRVLDRIGHTSIADLMALTQASSLVIANDSAVVHMAVGFDRPLIGLYGSTSPAADGPYRRNADVIYHPFDPSIRHKALASNELMQRITTQEVLARIPSPSIQSPGNPHPIPSAVTNH